MNLHPNPEGIIQRACFLLYTLAEDDDIAYSITAAGGIQVRFTALIHHPSVHAPYE